MKTLMLGRDVRTLNKLFEGVVHTPSEYEQLLVRLREVVVAIQKNVIKGLRY